MKKRHFIDKLLKTWDKIDICKEIGDLDGLRFNIWYLKTILRVEYNV